MSIKIIIADDHQLFREGMVKLLSNTDSITVIAEAENGEMVIEKAKEHNPDIILMDIGMPNMNGIEATQVIKRELPDIKIIALSMHAGKEYVQDILDAGASGYLLKSCAFDELIKAIKSVYNGMSFLSEKITEIVIQGYLEKNSKGNSIEELLSRRELEVLKLYAEGGSTQDIADKLFISTKTVSTHNQHIRQKLELKTNAEMVRYALKEGLVTL